MRVIAEVGSNFKTTNDALKSIELAKKAGAHVVKFQTYSREELYGPNVSHPKTGLRPPLELLKTWADSVGIDLMCTAFSARGYKYVDQFVKEHKIASSEITDHSILRAVNECKKPVMVSCGGALNSQIRDALELLKDCPVTLMYCVVAYPARIVDFRHLDIMKEIYGSGVSYGYSDHSLDVLTIPDLARLRGSVVLEKHVNFTEHKDTPDAPHSLNFDEFQMMCRHLRGELNPVQTFQRNPYQRKPKTINDKLTFVRPGPND